MLKPRTLTALILAPFGVAMILLLPTIAMAVITGGFVVVALWEWTRLSGFRSRPARAVMVAVGSLALPALWIVRDDAIAWWIIAAGVAWWFVAAWWLKNFSFGAAPTRENATIKLIVGILAVLPAWLALAKLHEGAAHGHGWALFSMSLVWTADVGAYVTGRRYGTTKLCPQISPNKTIAGVYGALASGVLLALIAAWLLDVHRVSSILLMVVLALVTVGASIVGDLFESLIKRQANVKDSGRLFPGHGGVFDRLDSVFAALPVFALGKALLDLAFGP